MVVDDDHSGGEVFETPEALVEAFSSAAMRAAGLSLTLLGAGSEGGGSSGSGGGGGSGGSDGVQVPGRRVRRRGSNDSGGGGGGSMVTTAENTVSVEYSEGVGVQRGGVGVGGGGGGGGAAAAAAGVTEVEETVVRWALFVCSKAPG